MSILCVDIGGTKANGCIIDRGQPQQRRHRFTRSSRGHATMGALLTAILADIPERPQAAALAVPGPVFAGTAVMANLGWQENAAAIAAEFGFARVIFANDLVATAMGLDVVAPERIRTVLAGTGGEQRGLRALVAPGTGLGAGFCIHDGHGWLAYPSEAGHAGFAPRTPAQLDLWRFAMTQEAHPILQTVTSGKGIAVIHAWLTARDELVDTPEASAAIANAADPSQAICLHAETSPRCNRALDVFVELVACECCDVAMRLLPTGGIYLMGGIPARYPERFMGEHFRANFLGVTDLAHVPAMMPVHVVDDADAALHGACAIGAGLTI